MTYAKCTLYTDHSNPIGLIDHFDSMTSSPSTYYTNLYPKRPDVSGSPAQAYNLTPTKYFDHLIGGITAGTIAAIGTLAPGSSILTYLYAPRIHTDLSGAFIGFVGNSSNKIGEFSCVFVSRNIFGLFPIIDTKLAIVGGYDPASAVSPLNSTLLSNTDWDSLSDTDEVIGKLLPNFFIIYFGQDIPQGDIADDDVKLTFSRLGPGYAAWIQAADSAISTNNDITTVFDNATAIPGYSEPDFLKNHFYPEFDQKRSLPLVDGPHGFITHVDSDLYKVEVDDIKTHFFPAAPSIAQPFTPAALSTITLTLPKDAEKEAEAKKGIHKLLLFHICGEIAHDNTIQGQLSYAKPSIGMEAVLETTRAARATGLADLIRNTCTVTKEMDCMNIKSRLCNLSYVNKAACMHILQGNFATEGVTSLNNEANAIDPSLFLPQRNACMLDKERTKDQLTRSENNMDIADTHKSKINVAINRIGTMMNMTDFSSLCINCDTIVAAIISADGPQPLWRHILLKFVSLLNNPDFDSWYNHTKTAMPLLHWHVYTFLERIYNHFALFATNFNNVNVIGKDRPLAELDIKPIQKALTVLNAFQVHLNLHMSQMIPITVFASSLSKFTLTPSANSSVCAVTPTSENSSLESDKNQPTTNQKRTPASPDDSAKAISTTQRKKKIRRDGITDSSARIRPVTDKGMFFLTNPSIKATDIFPKDMPDKLCADFTCKGRECTRDNCSFKHPRTAKELQKTTIIMIANHFASKGIGWFNAWHFSQIDDLPSEAAPLLGGKEGAGKSSTRKTA